MTSLKDHVLGWEREDIFTYLAIAVVIRTLVWLFKRQQKVWLLEQIPGPPSRPLIGNVFQLAVEPSEVIPTFMKLSDYGEVVRIWVGQSAHCLLNSSRAAEAVLSSQKHVTKNATYDHLQPWLGNGLLSSSGSHWHIRRKQLTPAFHFKILEDFIDVFNSQSQKLVRKLEQKADGHPFDIYPYITHCSLDIISETVMGNIINAQDNSESDYVKAVERMIKIIKLRQYRPWLHLNFMFRLLGPTKEHDACIDILHDMSRRAITERKRARAKQQEARNEPQECDKPGKKKRLRFLDLLLDYAEDNPDLTDENIREEVDTLMVAGFHTTSSALNWILYVIGLYPDIQAKVKEEIDGIFGSSDRPVTVADLRQMQYLENCIKETMRIFPPVATISRAIQEEVVINNYCIPAGTSVTVFIYKLHHDPEQFPDPEVFDPDRFLPENANKRHPFAYIPFSAGPRNCIGQKLAMMEMKTVVCILLRRFRVESQVPRENIEIISTVVLQPKNGNILKLFPREKLI
ncbi:cytochrome P450 4C1-like isoform X2 [Homarus americanus]|uniref:cytochrome P450 4C1-like isoform X2 n=1 Tax=Homarus americanus TaxID=6706 RepID=UPI001C488797|nr:cytochrome P450 4C1-like isoform X2 [Homarus americanus]